MIDDIDDSDTPLAGPRPPAPASNIRIMVRSCYDLQALRLQIGGRITANFKAKLGQAPSAPEEELGEDERKILDDLRADYKKLTDGLKRFPPQASFKGTQLITNYTEFCLLAQFIDMEKQEEQQFRRLGSILRDYPIFSEFLDNVKGIGPAMAGVILSEFDIHKAKYPSSLWAYAGLDTGPDGKGRSRRKEHLVKRAYTDKEGKPAERDSITYNPWLKTKLMGVLATSFIRCGENEYRTIYLNYKNRLENRPDWAERSKGHRHQAALRYMVKQFLVQLYFAWKKIEGLPVHTTYAEGKLGIKHSA